MYIAMANGILIVLIVFSDNGTPPSAIHISVDPPIQSGMLLFAGEDDSVRRRDTSVFLSPGFCLFILHTIISFFFLPHVLLFFIGKTVLSVQLQIRPYSTRWSPP